MSSSTPHDDLVDRYNQALNKEKESFAIEALQQDTPEPYFTGEEPTEEVDEPLEFLNSLRGHYIISQALYYGIKALEKIDVPYQETSNLEDMKYLKENLFGLPNVLFDNSIAEEAFNKLRQSESECECGEPYDELEMRKQLQLEEAFENQVDQLAKEGILSALGEPTTCTDDYHVVDDCTSGDQVLCNCGEATFTNCDDPNCPC